MEIHNFYMSTTPHIQIDAQKGVIEKDIIDFKDLLPNPDVNIIYKSDETKENHLISPEVNENKIIINQYRTTINLLQAHKDNFMEEVSLILGDISRYNMSESNDVFPKVIPASLKKRVLAWVYIYKLYVLIESLHPEYTIEHKKQLKNIYLNDVKQVVSFVFQDVHWTHIIEEVKEKIKNEELTKFDKRFQDIKQKILDMGGILTHSQRVEELRKLNSYIVNFASMYHTQTFPINNYSFDRLKLLVSKVNKEHALHLEIV
jgi:hypothetical protein